MKQYTCGFAFNADLDNVALIRKERPDWQRNRWNGIGGHMEDGETPEECMRREFREETSVDLTKWTHFATLRNPRGTVYMFYAVNNDIYDAVTMTDETVEVMPIDDLPEVLPNLRWLIPMALAHRAGDKWFHDIAMEAC